MTNHPDLLIRDARPEELDEVSLLLRHAYRRYEDSVLPAVWKSYLENLTDVRSRLDVSELMVGELNRRLVGAVTLYLDGSRSEHEGWPVGWAGIRLLATQPSSDVNTSQSTMSTNELRKKPGIAASIVK